MPCAAARPASAAARLSRPETNTPSHGASLPRPAFPHAGEAPCRVKRTHAPPPCPWTAACAAGKSMG